MEENNNELTNFFVFIPANSCEHKNEFSNCNVLKKNYSCEHDFVKKNCKASCECEDKIY